jgi:hypothetical protein
VLHHAIKAAAAEIDGSGFENATARDGTLLGHGSPAERATDFADHHQRDVNVTTVVELLVCECEQEHRERTDANCFHGFEIGSESLRYH